MSNNTVQTIKLADYKAPDFSVVEHQLLFNLEEEKTTVTHKQEFNAKSTGKPLVLNGENLVLISVAIDGEKLSPDAYEYKDNLLTIKQVPEKFILETVVEIDPDSNKELSGLYRSNGVFCTQCEAEGFRRISFALDRPDVLATYRVRIEADKKSCPVLLSNGDLVGEGELENGRHYTEWHDPHPKPSYLFALVGGDLAHIQRDIVTPHGHKIDLRIYTEHEFIKQTDFAMESLINSIKWDETRFNLDYDLGRFNIVAVSDFNMGAMENKSLNIFNTKYILGDIETATDSDFHGIEGVIGHEYFHNWTGDRITCRDWFQLSLKEGLTVFRDQEFSGDMGEPALERIKNVNLLRSYQFAEDAGPLSHPVQPQEYAAIDNFYTATVYEKGAEVIRMYHTILGEEGFQKGMALYVERHDGQAVRIEDFAKCMEDASGFPFTQHFFKWYTTKGTPKVAFESSYDIAAKSLTLKAKQDLSCVSPEIPLLIPVRFSLINEKGEHYSHKGERGPDEKLWILEKEEETLVLQGVEPGFFPVLMHNFTAPIHYSYNYTNEQLAAIAFHAKDAFARYEALQTNFRGLFDLAVEQNEDAYKKYLNQTVNLLISILNHEERSPGEKALSLSLPSVRTIINTLTPPIDMDAILAADKRVAEDIAKGLEEAALNYLDNDHSKLDPNYSIGDAQIRSLRAVLMHHLATTQNSEYRARFADAYKNASNMTERMAALNALNKSNDAARSEALESFATKFETYPLVIDKWFTLQGYADFDDALDSIKQLAEDPRFVVTNPNRFRSLIGAFSSNYKHFHAKDGSGYEFVVSQIKRILTLNGRLAARVLNIFAIAPTLDADRQKMIANILTPLQDVPGVSVDVLEVIERILKGINQ